MSRRLTRVTIVSFLCFGFWGLTVPAANAYLGPDVGSMIIQWVVGFFAMVGAALVVFREKVRSWFTRKPPSLGDGDTEG